MSTKNVWNNNGKSENSFGWGVPSGTVTFPKVGNPFLLMIVGASALSPRTIPDFSLWSGSGNNHNFDCVGPSGFIRRSITNRGFHPWNPRTLLRRMEMQHGNMQIKNFNRYLIYKNEYRKGSAKGGPVGVNNADVEEVAAAIIRGKESHSVFFLLR